MKYCPQCQKQYTEVWITFCSDDGTILIDTDYQSQSATSNRPPYAPPSSEQPTWRSPDPNAPGGWVSPADRPPIAPAPWQPPPPPAVYPRQQQNQSLAVASMIVGILGLFIGQFCLGPIPGIVALVLGLVALSQIKKSPHLYSGKPFAIVGIITGSLSTLISGAFLLLTIIGNIFS